MDLIEGLKTRRSIRSYSDTEVPDSLIEELFEAVRWAPSAVNNQPWRFIIIKDQERKRSLRGGLRDMILSTSAHILNAPVLVVAWYEPSLVLSKYQLSDVSNAVTYLLLAAHAKGLGACWIGWFSENRVRKILNLPGRAKVAALVTLGFPRETPAPRKRKSVHEILFREKHTGSW